MKVRVEPVILLLIIRRVIGGFQDQTDRHEITLKVSDSIFFVMADVNKTEMILNNLIKNAIKYSPDGGRIWVEVIFPGNGEVGINIIDEGVGIPEEHIEKIFGPFYRVDAGDDRKIYGHGLGLHISKRLVELQGGRIWVRSQEGTGSCFTFTLPTVQESEFAEEELEV